MATPFFSKQRLSATDIEDGDLSSTLLWSSNLDGDLGAGAQLTLSTLSVGNHVLTANSVDSSGLTGSATISIAITESLVDTPPTINLSSPSEGSRFVQGETVTLNAAATDEQDGDLSNVIVWSSSLDGDLGTGASVALTTLTVGEHRLSATVTDNGNNTVTAAATIAITDESPPESCALECSIDLSAFEPQSDSCDKRWSFRCIRSYLKHRKAQQKALQCNTTETANCKASKSLPWYFVKDGIKHLEQVVHSGGAVDTVLQWSSSVDGELGYGQQLTAQLSPGKHRITLQVNGKVAVKTLIKVKQKNQLNSVVAPTNISDEIAIQPTENGDYVFKWVAINKENLR